MCLLMKLVHNYYAIDLIIASHFSPRRVMFCAGSDFIYYDIIDFL